MTEGRCLSLRDPSGRLFELDGRLIRVVEADAAADIDPILAWLAHARPFGRGRVVTSTRLDDSSAFELYRRLRDAGDRMVPPALVLEHEKIEIVSYPYEWAPAMLHAAGALTLELAEDALGHGFGLKDATPYNVLFEGPEPVFVDLLSFERRDANDPTWLACGQFMRSFILPLLLNSHFGMPVTQTLLARRDGPEPEEAYRVGRGWRGPLTGGFLTTVTIPMLLGRLVGSDPAWLYKRRMARSATEASFVLRALFGRLRRLLERTAPGRRSSHWTGYREDSERGLPEYMEAKRAFVQRALETHSSRRVLDVGCNTGEFSRLAARTGASVVAIDSDPQVVDELWREARERNEPILPLVVDLARPTPGIGWLNQECPSFLERLDGAIDCVLMLAIVHHLRVTEGIPLAEIVRLMASLTSDIAVIEFVDPRDPMFRRLARGREHLYVDYTRDTFERDCAEFFEVVQQTLVNDSTRWLYLLKKRIRG